MSLDITLNNAIVISLFYALQISSNTFEYRTIEWLSKSRGTAAVRYVNLFVRICT